MKKTAVLGSFVVDLMARSPHMPLPGETVKGTMFKMGAGGKGFNQCVAAHKSGANVTMITKVGKDEFSNVLFSNMDSLSMNKEHVFVSDKESTGSALIIVDEKTSQNEIVVIPGACNDITKEEVQSIENVIKDSDYLLLQLEINQDANEIAAELAVKNNCKVIVNTAPYSPISDEFLSKVYMVTPNEVEAEEITGIHIDGIDSAKKAAAYFKDRGVEIVIITLGSKGVFISYKGEERIVPAFNVNAIDTTGAGDAFNGGMLTALSEGMDIWQAVEFSNALAAIAVQRYGTTPAMPSRDEIDEFIKMHK